MSLPKQPDDITTTLLTKALLFLAHATQHSTTNSVIDRMVAIHGFDNSIEYLLRIIVTHLDIEAATGKNLDNIELSSLAGEINRHLKDAYDVELPYLSDIKMLRQSRNLVQHGLLDPQTDLPRMRKITERFFQRVLSIVFGIENGTLKISNLARNQQVKEHLQSAERLLDEHKYLESIIASRDAFENAKHEKTKHSTIRLSLLPALVESKLQRISLLRFIETVGDELELSRLDVDITKYQRYVRYIRHIPNEIGSIIMQRPWNIHDARFCYDFVSSAVLLWQSIEPENLYPLNLTDSYEWETNIGGVIIPRGTEHGCTYVHENPAIGCMEEMNLYFMPRESKDKLSELKSETSIVIKGKIFKNGIFEREYSRSGIFLGSYARLATHNPERWEVILWWRMTDHN